MMANTQQQQQQQQQQHNYTEEILNQLKFPQIVLVIINETYSMFMFMGSIRLNVGTNVYDILPSIRYFTTLRPSSNIRWRCLLHLRQQLFKT